MELRILGAVHLSEGPEITAITLDPLCPPFELRRTAETRPVLEINRSERATPGDQFPLDFDAVIANREIELIRAALESARYQQQGGRQIAWTELRSIPWPLPKIQTGLRLGPEPRSMTST